MEVENYVLVELNQLFPNHYLQKFTFSQDNLTANTKYFYRWKLVTPDNSSLYSPSETGTSSFTTLTGFDVFIISNIIENN